jgi:NAD(P)-dependent dehydrogenase (short-subunit alcohol dehydrogenase family)
LQLSSNIENILLIGASGGIAQACLDIILSADSVKQIITVSRSQMDVEHQKQSHYQVPDYDDENIQNICQKLPVDGVDLVICTLGVLHDDNALFPEKKIEEVSSKSLTRYFQINSIIPALWLKHLVGKMRKKAESYIVLLSARVGSIGDNQLGGWYGYRASKSALNMLVKTAQVEYLRRCPGCELVLYHPGTVDTHLSKPFQRNVKPEKLFSPKFTAEKLLDIPNNKPDSTPPYYLDWQHKTINW